MEERFGESYARAQHHATMISVGFKACIVIALAVYVIQRLDEFRIQYEMATSDMDQRASVGSMGWGVGCEIGGSGGAVTASALKQRRHRGSYASASPTRTRAPSATIR